MASPSLRHGNCLVAPVEAVVEPLRSLAPKAAMEAAAEIGVLAEAEAALALMVLVAVVGMVAQAAKASS